ncbi:MAG TPA: hypothetical protein VG265_05785 [Gaiellaceae bacterium]|nr:hypothetical protein [Gaiellaceae bacterium]
MGKHLIWVSGFQYELVPGEEAKLSTFENGVLANDWLEVVPRPDAFCGDVPGQRIQLSQVVSYVELPDETPESG